MERPKLIDAPWGADEFLNNSAVFAESASKHVRAIREYALAQESEVKRLTGQLAAEMASLYPALVETRAALGAGPYELIQDAARRVVAERDAAIADARTADAKLADAHAERSRLRACNEHRDAQINLINRQLAAKGFEVARLDAKLTAATAPIAGVERRPSSLDVTWDAARGLSHAHRCEAESERRYALSLERRIRELESAGKAEDAGRPSHDWMLRVTRNIDSMSQRLSALERKGGA
jgi:chromosome segregation ATPase